MEPIVVGAPRARGSRLLAVSLCFAAAGVLIVASGENPLVGWATLLFFGGGAAMFARQLADRRPRVVIDDAGILDRTLGVGVIEWDDVEHATPGAIHGTGFVSLHLRDPEKYLGRLSPTRRRLAELNRRMGFTELSLNLSGTDADPGQLSARIVREIAARRGVGAATQVPMNALRFEVTDDSGFLALVDPDAYQGFVGEDWTFDELAARFRAEMAGRRLLVWGTGREEVWTVEVAFEPREVRGFREVAGTIASSRGRLLLTSYDALTVVAQFADEPLPAPHEREQVVRVPPGVYRCRVVQLRDPDAEDGGRGGPDFVVELRPEDAPVPPWTDIPWRG